MKIAGIIPARYASSRFPGKPLALIHGIPMVVRVYRQAIQAASLTEVLVATDDERIADCCRQWSVPFLMTSGTHLNGTSRCAEAAKQIPAEGIINIQGDEPLVSPQLLEQMAIGLQSGTHGIVTAVKAMPDDQGIEDPARIKVVMNHSGNALYFSRSPIPFNRDGKTSDQRWHKHIGIYGFLLPVLNELIALPPSPLELLENLEQLRWLENGFSIQCLQTEEESISVDTPEDLKNILKYF